MSKFTFFYDRLSMFFLRKLRVIGVYEGFRQVFEEMSIFFIFQHVKSYNSGEIINFEQLMVVSGLSKTKKAGAGNEYLAQRTPPLVLACP